MCIVKTVVSDLQNPEALHGNLNHLPSYSEHRRFFFTVIVYADDLVVPPSPYGLHYNNKPTALPLAVLFIKCLPEAPFSFPSSNTSSELPPALPISELQEHEFSNPIMNTPSESPETTQFRNAIQEVNTSATKYLNSIQPAQPTPLNDLAPESKSEPSFNEKGGHDHEPPPSPGLTPKDQLPLAKELSEKLQAAASSAPNSKVKRYYLHKAKFFLGVAKRRLLKIVDILTELVKGCALLLVIPVAYLLGSAWGLLSVVTCTALRTTWRFLTTVGAFVFETGCDLLNAIGSIACGLAVTVGVVVFWVVGGVYAIVQIGRGRMRAKEIWDYVALLSHNIKDMFEEF
ncbi:hypothetical protein K435DRAFT_960511 [Dendrothele bispora CBS 962.96]|uniref:Uncharacterized protein n=1 Tax=Dendrothele bispora (strain CBS 962.96) TaxID=1314807 RepID=A0A4S8MTK0_DENBC|nr:hypothetical protein K435DRAFT_960511 [Dendrothele bispora CBS 962.96]